MKHALYPQRHIIRTRLDSFYQYAAAGNAPEAHRLAVTIEYLWGTRGYASRRYSGPVTSSNSQILRAYDCILFIGDSVTDAGRVRIDGSSLGDGYVRDVAALLASRHPELGVTILNRGVGGDRAVDLQARWTRDCLELEPTVVTVLIGINDTWRRFDFDDPTTTQAYEASLRDILDQARVGLNPRFVLIEPFALPVPPVTAEWRPDLDPRIGVIGRLAEEYGAVLVPADELFAGWALEYGAPALAADGVHATALGHDLLAGAWMDAVGA
jgi:lysophospholipase L1-like esterase